MLRLNSRRDRLPVVTWVALGAGLTYLLDPVAGSSRRASVRNALVQLARIGKRGAVLGAAVLRRALANMPFGQRLQSTRQRLVGNREGSLAMAEPAAGGTTPLEPTPSGQAEEVARSIRE
jgi:hypothetical protein